MTITYQTTFTAICPVDQTTDIYELTIVTNNMIMVESILEAIRESTAHPAYQEEITGNLAHRLREGTVTTIGVHSGVTTTVTK